MEVVEVLEKHREYLSLSFSNEVIEGLQRLILGRINSQDLDKALTVALAFARRVVASRDNINEFKIVIDFLINREICTSDILDIFIYLIQNKSELESNVKILLVCKNFEKISVSEILDIIKDRKINCVIFKFFDMLFNSNLSNINSERFRIILDAVLSNNLGFQGDQQKLNYIVQILSNELIDNLDNQAFKKLSLMCFNNSFWFPFYRLLISDLPISKKKVAFSYYLIVMSQVSIRKFETEFLQDIFMVVFNYSNTSDKEYSDILESIIEAYDKDFYAKIINSGLPKDYQQKALDYQRDIATNKYLSELAASTLMKALSIEDYQKLMDLISNLCWKIEASDDNRKVLFKSKIEPIIKIFNNSYYKDNMARLEYVMRVILDSSDLYAINEIGYFAGHQTSEYYFDLEFKRAVEILQDTSVIDFSKRIYGSKYFLFSKLFTNENVPFMDKNALMDIAMSEESDAIMLTIHKFNQIGMQNQNIVKIIGSNSSYLEYDRVRSLVQYKN